MLVAHRSLALVADRCGQPIHVVIHILQHFANAVAFDDFVDPPVAVVVETDVCDMRVTEEIVEVAQRLLICANEERAEEVAVAVFDVVEFEGLLYIVVVNESVDLSIRVAFRRGGESA